MTMLQLEGDCLKCQRCKLSKTRNNVVFGEGVTDRPLVMVIGEGPGETEDITGRPFVGKAGQFLDTWLKAISLSRETNTYIANIVKCRPPQNRDPEIDEKENCFGYLKQQIALIKPQAILCLGKPASIKMTGLEESMSTLHGKCHFYDGIPTICTYHPAAVLRDMSLKRPVWEDLQKLARLLNLEYGKRK
ncbi:MAG: uracil-DNA glycosylase [Sphaerochaetaceae bacterium]|nr:uracil-DNA glycosylase [Sphaerochaetaceae bacterium]